MHHGVTRVCRHGLDRREPAGTRRTFSPVNAFPMSTTYRGFELTSSSAGPDAEQQTVCARRGRITLRVHLAEGPMPQGWTLQDVLRVEIDRLIDPKAMRDVDHLN